ncbi:MAG: hypothetical protein IK066_01140 [Kiritimatiellae bacterium]|nr:hypothetical protein [Kiritimatiellia bacterium]
MSDTPIQPIDLSAAKAATSRIDLSKATPPAPGTPPSIRIGVNPSRTTGRIDLSAIPGAQAPLRPVEPAPAETEDVFKRRTALLDTSKIPLSATPAPAPAAASGGPRTIRVARPTIRVGGSSSSASTFSPGRPESDAPAAAAAPAKPTIKLKRPGGATVSVSPSAATVTAPTLAVGSSDFAIANSEDEVGGVWTVFAILGFLVAAGVIAFQVMTMNGFAY